MEKKKINLLAVQIESAIANIDINIKKVESLLVDLLSNFSADFVFLPEVWTCGWDCESFNLCAENIESAKSVANLFKISFSVSIDNNSSKT